VCTSEENEGVGCLKYVLAHNKYFRGQECVKVLALLVPLWGRPHGVGKAMQIPRDLKVKGTTQGEIISTLRLVLPGGVDSVQRMLQ
jgi:hypothetical protein